MVVEPWRLSCRGCRGGDDDVVGGVEVGGVVDEWWRMGDGGDVERRWCGSGGDGDEVGGQLVVCDLLAVGGRVVGDGRNLASGGRRKMGERKSMCGG
ncbi:hypothetical protein Tco_0707561 [Tanacetum coccineum]|uniref:Uncharacterized protein n=1 Tax=Tanacetum coccineum TaxID=301880 RepID=A0ABQ4YBD7_9ASTR